MLDTERLFSIVHTAAADAAISGFEAKYHYAAWRPRTAISRADSDGVPRDLQSKAGEPSVERYLDSLNQELLDRLQRGGEAFVSNAVVHGRYLLRACIVNFHTTRADVEAVPEIVTRIGRATDSELRRNYAASQ